MITAILLLRKHEETRASGGGTEPKSQGQHESESRWTPWLRPPEPASLVHIQGPIVTSPEDSRWNPGWVKGSCVKQTETTLQENPGDHKSHLKAGTLTICKQ